MTCEDKKWLNKIAGNKILFLNKTFRGINWGVDYALKNVIQRRNTPMMLLIEGENGKIFGGVVEGSIEYPTFKES
jgi:hypothetical protein